MVGKIKNTITFVGRLEKDTDILGFLEWADNNKKYKIDFVGDGNLRKECERYGIVHGFTDPTPFLRTSEWCVPGGFLSYIEAVGFNCKIKTFPSNPLKKEYWKEIYGLRRFPSWNQIANEYIRLYNST